MKKLFSVFLMVCLLQANVNAKTALDTLAEQYFNAWTASQAPGATSKDLENYLALLKDDVGHQHLPFDPDDARLPDNKELMREGMAYYLGAHSAYKAKFIDQIIGPEVIILVFEHEQTGTHPQTKQTSTSKYKTTEIIEVEDGLVSVIRKYTEKL